MSRDKHVWILDGAMYDETTVTDEVLCHPATAHFVPLHEQIKVVEVHLQMLERLQTFTATAT